MKAKEERSREDKNRELRLKKKKQKLKAARREKDEAKKPTKTPRDKLKMLKKVGKIRRVPEVRLIRILREPMLIVSFSGFGRRLERRHVVKRFLWSPSKAGQGYGHEWESGRCEDEERQGEEIGCLLQDMMSIFCYLYDRQT